MYGLKDCHITLIVGAFSQFPQIEQALIYGSRAKGDYRNGSDIDLCLKGNELSLSLLFKVEAALDDLMLPHTIDLSLYSNIDNPDLIEHIDRVGLVFYQKQS